MGFLQQRLPGLAYFANIAYHLRAHLRIGVQIGLGSKAFYLPFSGFYDAFADELAFFGKAIGGEFCEIYRGNFYMQVYPDPITDPKFC
jgi:hypothetical protein